MAFGTATVLTALGRAVTTNRLIGSGTVPNYVGIGTGATSAARTASTSDTSLSTPVESRVNTNAATQVTTSTTNDTFQVIQTVTASSSRSVDEAGLFDASSGGNMFLSATFPVVSLSSGIQATLKVQYS